ncbi:hypothetical protein SAMN05216464_11070 [Mucilaginibacter pineti]|uniref:Uncharacterized protein n=1 Tax=Mucilaginibacter pineti TaxID=1391627 RepID=A0A1G7GBV3_9SPHI|nr:hypothetical protein [Mucilaginibacter pineti]SDE85618.1 hypothetical protein SAMN05216464_11070 [Mucilaginibacter pineti]
MMLQPIAQIYRIACREIPLAPDEKVLFMRLLREISVNAARSRKAWTLKEDFISLWWISIGRFPSLTEPLVCEIIVNWVSKHLPFELTDSDYQFLVN